MIKICTFFFFFFAFYFIKSRDQKIFTKIDKKLSNIAKNSLFSGMNKKRENFFLKAKKIKEDQSYQIFMEDLDFFLDGANKVFLNSQFGTYSLKKKKIYLSENIKINIKNNFFFETEKLLFDCETQIAQVPSIIKAYSNSGFYVYSHKAIFINETHFSFFKNLKVIFVIKKNL